MSNLCEKCKTELPTSGLYLGVDTRRVPIVLFSCPNCCLVQGRGISALDLYTFLLADFPPKPGECSGSPDGVTVCCPICRGVAGVTGLGYQIAPDGNVTPTWVCPYNCGFHAMIKIGAFAGRGAKPKANKKARRAVRKERAKRDKDHGSD